MTTPRLEIFLENNSLYIAKVDRDAPRKLIVDIDVDELKALSPSDASYRVGGTVLNMLKLWHAEVFGEWEVQPVFKPPAK